MKHKLKPNDFLLVIANVEAYYLLPLTSNGHYLRVFTGEIRVRLSNMLINQGIWWVSRYLGKARYLIISIYLTQPVHALKTEFNLIARISPKKAVRYESY